MTVRHIRLLAPCAGRMEIGTDRIRQKPACPPPARDRPQKLPAPCPTSKQNSTLSGRDHLRLHAAAEAIDQLDLPVVIHVRVNVAGPQMLEQLLLVVRPEFALDPIIYHDRHFRPAVPPRPRDRLQSSPFRQNEQS